MQEANASYLHKNKQGKPGFTGSFGGMHHYNSGLDRFNGHPIVIADAGNSFYDRLEQSMQGTRCLLPCSDRFQSVT